MKNLVHQPNNPRTHDADGHKVNEPQQCAGCLQLWPCEVTRLRRHLAAGRGGVDAPAAEA